VVARATLKSTVYIHPPVASALTVRSEKAAGSALPCTAIVGSRQHPVRRGIREGHGTDTLWYRAAAVLQIEYRVYGAALEPHLFRSQQGRYDPISDTWFPISLTNAPSARYGSSAVWADNRIIVWGGEIGDPANHIETNDGAAYDPVSDIWSPVTTVNAPAPRTEHTAIWSGSRMIVWGGKPESNREGGLYDLLVLKFRQLAQFRPVLRIELGF
jgi:hypothetical protein